MAMFRHAKPMHEPALSSINLRQQRGLSMLHSFFFPFFTQKPNELTYSSLTF